MPIKNVIISDDITVSGRKLRFQTSNTIQFDFDSETDAYIGGGEAPIAFVGEPTTDELRNIVSDGYLPKRVAKEDVTIELYDTEGNKFYETSTVVSYYVETKDFTSQQFIGDQPKEEVQQFDPAIAGEIPETDGINYQLGIVPPSLPPEPFIPESFLGFMEVTGSDQISGSSSPITGTDAFTVEFRFRTHRNVNSAFLTEDRRIVGWGDSTVAGGKAQFKLDEGAYPNALRFEWQGGNLIAVSSSLNDATWHMATITKPAGDDGTLSKLYVDGVEYETSGAIGQQIDIVDTEPLQVGGVFQGGSFSGWIGHIDELRIWNTVRTQEDISSSIDGTVQADSDGLVAYYKFNGGSFPVTDEVGSNDLNVARGFPRLSNGTVTISASVVQSTISSGSNRLITSASVEEVQSVASSSLTTVTSSMPATTFYSGSASTTVSESITVATESVTAPTSSNVSSLDFSGINDYISYGSGSDTAFITDNLNEFAVSFWIESIETEQEYFFGSINDADATTFLLRMNTNRTNGAEANNLRLFVRDASGIFYEAAMATPPTIFDGDWHHILINRTGTFEAEFWIDGVQRTNDENWSGTTGTYSEFEFDFVVGGLNNRGSIGTFYNGVLDEFTFHIQSLTSTEIAEYYKNQRWSHQYKVALESKFDGDVAGVTASNIEDTSGNNRDGTPFGDIEYISNIPFKGTGSFEFPIHSFDSYITAPSVDAGQGDYTYEVWFKSNFSPPVSPKVELISEKFQSVGGTENSQSFAIRMDNNGKIEHWIRDNTGTEYSASTAGSFNDDNWHRAVARRNGSDISITLLAQGTDAIEESVTETAVANVVSTGSSQLIMGVYAGSTVEQFGGYMTDARIWNDYRTDAEITGSSSTTLSGSEAGLIWYSPMTDAEIVDLVSGSNGTGTYVRASNRKPF